VTPEKQSLPLIRRIYEAALEPPLWSRFVEEFSAACGDAAVAFVLQMPGQPSVTSGVYTTGFIVDDPGLRATFLAHTQRGLPWEEARRQQFLGRFGLASEVFPDSKVEKTEFYHEWMEPQGLAPVGPMGHTIELEEGRPVATLAVYRKRGGGPFRSRDLALGDLLVPHLAQAYRIHAEVREKAALAEALDRLPTGIVLLDSRGHPVLTNQAAEQLQALDDGFRIDASGPRAATAADDAVLKQLIRDAIDSSSTGQLPEGSVMAVSRPSGKRAFPLMAAPLLSSGEDTALHDAVAVLFVSDLEAQSLPRGEALRSLYALTHAEIELVELLCDGYSLEEAAERRGVTMNTARSQLKQVFVKTRTSRQSELVRLVLAGIAPIRNP
jgi:DNA-binding CsgD family transcriptional regulator/PAS domain-containing protein